MKKLFIQLIILTIAIIESHAEILIEGQPEYIPLIEGTHLEAYYPSMDASGRIVAFTTCFPIDPEHEKVLDLVNYHNTQVYVFDREENRLEIISVNPEGGALKHGYCYNVHCSGDSRFVGFNSISYEFVPFSYEIRYGEQVYLRDRIDKKNYHISKTIDGNPAPKECLLNDISQDGRYVLFSSESTNLTDRATNGNNQIFLCDRLDDSTQCVSTTQEGEFANSKCEDASFSSDAKYIAFNSYATNWTGDFPSPDINPSTAYQVVLKDRESGEVRVLTKDWMGQLGTGTTQGEPQISDDGRWIAFLYNQPLLPNLPKAWVYVYLYERETHAIECIAPLKPKYNHYSDYYYSYPLLYKLILSGDGQTLFWYQGRWEYDNVDVYRYTRSNREIQRVVYSSEVPWQEFDPLGLFTSEGYCTNYDGSVFLFTTGSKELTPLYNQGSYQSPFPHELWPSYRLLLVSFGISSQSGGWDWLR